MPKESHHNGVGRQKASWHVCVHAVVNVCVFVCVYLKSTKPYILLHFFF